MFFIFTVKCLTNNVELVGTWVAAISKYSGRLYEKNSSSHLEV